MRRALAALAAALPLLGGCSGEIAPPAARPRVLLLACDGLEWSELMPLVRAGEMPVIEGLLRDGRYGRLLTFTPTLSPIIWTSIATSRPYTEHGITGFVRSAPDGTPISLFQSTDRQNKAFWNVLSDYGVTSAVVGWWMTYPAEPIRGLMVAQVNTMDQFGHPRKRPIKGGLIRGASGQVHPPEREEEMLRIHDGVMKTLPQRVRDIFGEFTHPLVQRDAMYWEGTQWSFRCDATYLEIAESLEPETFDVVAVYVGGTDVVAHRFWRHAHPEDFDDPPTEEQVRDLGHLVRDYYRHVDERIGRVLARYPERPTVFVVSDHGMRSFNTRFPFHEDTQSPALSGNHNDAPPGVAILSGPGVLPGQRLEAPLPVMGSVMDVTPTLLALLGVPAGRDMQGEAWRYLLEAPPVEPVDTHEDEEWMRLAAERRSAGGDSPGQEARMEQLRSLGYIE